MQKDKRGKMEKSVAITLIIVLGIVFVAFLGFLVFINLNPSITNTVSVNGQSSIDVTPDLVTVYFNVETKADTAQEAKDKNAEIVDSVITELIKERFERKQIETQNFNIYPNYDWNNGNQKITGYTATHSLKVELSTEDADKIGDVIDAGVDAGANINYINFELSQEKQNQYKAEAVKLASEDARIKAEAIAEGLNKKLGALVSVSDNSFDYYPWPIYQARADSGIAIAEEAKVATTNIQPGEQTISAQVTAIFKLR